MAEFRYRAVGRDGEHRRGALVAEDEEAVVKTLHAQNLVPFEIEKGGSFQTSLEETARQTFARPALSDENALFLTRELASLLEAGMEIDKCLQLLSDLVENKSQRALLSRLLSRIQEGAQLSEALKAETGRIVPYLSAMVRTGELSGTLTYMLRAVAVFIARTKETHETIKTALLYPCVLLVVTVGSIVFLISFVFPRFKSLFEATGSAPPAFASVIFAIGEFLGTYWWEGLFAVLVLLISIRQVGQSRLGKQKLDGWLLGFPIVGSLIIKIETARHARALATSLKGGVPLVTALRAVTDVIRNADLRAKAQQLERHVREGKRLSQAADQESLYPTSGLQAITIGEKSGNLSSMLDRVADLYDRDCERKVKRYLALMTPLLTILSGLIIGGLIATIMTTVLSLNDVPL